VIGPGSGGVLNLDPAVRLNATYAAALPVHGGLAVVSQVGAEGTALIEELHGAGLAVHSYVSLGESADVTAADLVRAWANDDSVDAVAVVLGGLRHRPAVWVAAQQAARSKPVLTWCTDEPAHRATGRGGPDRSRAAAELPALALRQAGVSDVSCLDELLDTARLLSGQPHAAGPRLGMVGNAPELDHMITTTAREVNLTLPDSPGQPNPWNLPPLVDPVRLADTMNRVLDSGAVDQVLAVVTPNRAVDLPGLLWTLARELDRRPGIPAAVVVPGHGGRTLGDRRVPVFDSVERATRALGRAADYALRRGGPARRGPWPGPGQDEAGTAPIRRHRRL
jgi:acyl-CoA synthetase (NDP forming)